MMVLGGYDVCGCRRTDLHYMHNPRRVALGFILANAGLLLVLVAANALRR